MLVHEHSCGDAAHVEAVQEVLNVLVGHGVHAKGLFVLHHTLSHGWHHVVVPITDVLHSLYKSVGKDKMDMKLPRFPHVLNQNQGDFFEAPTQQRYPSGDRYKSELTVTSFIFPPLINVL